MRRCRTVRVPDRRRRRGRRGGGGSVCSAGPGERRSQDVDGAGLGGQDPPLQPDPDRAVFELDGGVGQAAEGDRQPEVDGAVGEHGGQRLPVGQPRARQHRHEDELHDAQPPRGDGDGSQDVGQPVGGQQVDGGDDVGEGRHEHPQRGGVEEPVGGGPAHRPGQQRLVLHQHREPPGQALDQGSEAVGVEEPDVRGHGMDDPPGPFLAAGEQVEEAAEGAEQDHADRRGHQQQDGRRRGSVAVHPRGPEPVRGQERHQ